jgi:DNA methylase
MTRTEHLADGVTLHLGDCREILPTLPRAPAMITDPPYGVNIGAHKALRDNRPHLLRKGGYESYDDTPENFDAIIVPALTLALGMVERGAIFTAGSKLGKLPEPAAIGGIYTPAGTGRNAWGFTCFHAIALFGICPTLRHGARKTVLQSSEAAEPNGHPVPKPIGWMRWLVNLASVQGETILDPFAGSGTTGVACIEMGRKFVGIEIDPGYFDIACRRIGDALKRPDMFIEQPARARPAELDLTTGR